MIRQVLLAVAIAITPLTSINADTKDSINVIAPWEISGTDPATDGFIFQRMGIMESLVNTDANGALEAGYGGDR